MFGRIRRWLEKLLEETGPALKRLARAAAKRASALEKELKELRKARTALEHESTYAADATKKMSEIYKGLIQKKLKEIAEAKKEVERLRRLETSFNQNLKGLEGELASAEKQLHAVIG
jgi:hypothetical protein